MESANSQRTEKHSGALRDWKRVALISLSAGGGLGIVLFVLFTGYNAYRSKQQEARRGIPQPSTQISMDSRHARTSTTK